MKNTIPTYRVISIAVAIAGFCTAGLAVAQQITEEIVVRAPIERTEVTSLPGAAVTTELIELNRFVSFSDLDLSKSADVAELDVRITAIAKESCQKLSDMFPLDRTDVGEMRRCVHQAVKSAGKEKAIAIAAAP